MPYDLQYTLYGPIYTLYTIPYTIPYIPFGNTSTITKSKPASTYYTNSSLEHLVRSLPDPIYYRIQSKVQSLI